MYNPTKLDRELKEAGIPIVGVAATGRVDFAEEATDEQKKLAQEVLAQHDPTSEPTVKEQYAELRTLEEKVALIAKRLGLEE
jgi:hypothetical protein